MTMAPLVADGIVMTGICGAEFGTRDFIDGWDPATGNHVWRTYTVPSPDEPGGDTWKGDTWKFGGGSTWITGSYDPDLNTVYWGSATRPFNAAVRPGDNLFTCSVLALDRKPARSNGTTSSRRTTRSTIIPSPRWCSPTSTSTASPPRS